MSTGAIRAYAKPRSISRFYYQWNIDNKCWCVYDREFIDHQGECIPIADCPNKTYAIYVRDAMIIWNETSNASP